MERDLKGPFRHGVHVHPPHLHTCPNSPHTTHANPVPSPHTSHNGTNHTIESRYACMNNHYQTRNTRHFWPAVRSTQPVRSLQHATHATRGTQHAALHGTAHWHAARTLLAPCTPHKCLTSHVARCARHTHTANSKMRRANRKMRGATASLAGVLTTATRLSKPEPGTTASRQYCVS